MIVVGFGGMLAVCLAAVLWYAVWKRRSGQKGDFHVADMGVLVLFLALIAGITIHIFGSSIKMRYPSLCTAQNFATAMQLARGKSSVTAGFASVFAAFLIRVFSSVFAAADAYRAYIAADALIHLMELWMFYLVVRHYGKERGRCLRSAAFSIFWFFGYPAYTYLMGGQDDLDVKTMLLLLYLLVVQQSGVRRILQKHGWNKKYLPEILGCVIVAAGMFGGTFFHTADTTEIYASVYGDLIFFVPVFCYIVYNVLSGKTQEKLVGMLSVTALICILVLYTNWYAGDVSNTEYYRNYAWLWTLGWLLAAQAFTVAAERKEMLPYVSYAGMIVALAVLVVSGTAEAVTLSAMDLSYATKGFFSLYRYNTECLQTDYSVYEITEENLQFFQRAGEISAENIPLLTDDVQERTWYDAVSGKMSTAFDTETQNLFDLLGKMEKGQVEAFVIRRDGRLYQEYQNYFACCPVQAENDTYLLYGKPGNTWTDIPEDVVPDINKKLELYTYVVENLEGEQVPLMAAKASCLDFILYDKVTGQDSSAFYTWDYNARENIENLNAHGVRYVMMLKEDEYWISSETYYRNQIIIFENEVGVIMQCSEIQWPLT